MPFKRRQVGNAAAGKYAAILQLGPRSLIEELRAEAFLKCLQIVCDTVTK